MALGAFGRFACGMPAERVVRSFPPIAAPGARVLVLGSMPGVASLKSQQYYAHPRNVFWPILGELLGFDPGLAYDDRRERLRVGGVSVWDVLRACRRQGSLDAAIERDSEEPNDFSAFFADQSRIELVAFNGQKAETAFRRHVLSELDASIVAGLTTIRLPSTSPAHAGKSFGEKLAAWRDALEPALGG